MKFSITLILLFFLFSSLSFGQKVYNDLLFEGLKGKVKTTTSTIEYADTAEFHMDRNDKVISYYKENGNRSQELVCLDTSVVQKRDFIYIDFKGCEKRIQKITTFAIESSNRMISNYYYDESGFDTLIVVCFEDSSYYQLHKYKKNKYGLRSKGVDSNAKNGNISGSFEIYYLNENVIDSITYRNGYDKILYTEFYIYNSKGEIEQTYYSDGGCHLIKYSKVDDKGNWLEKKTFYMDDDQLPGLISTRIRSIEYYSD